VPRPEWYFLLYFQLLKYFEGPIWGTIGVVVLPLVVILILFALPLLDRSPERRPRLRPYGMAAAGAAVVVVTVLTYFGAVQAPPGTRQAPAGSPQALLDRGHEVFVANKCQGCHVVKGEGTDFGPDLTHVGARLTADKLKALIRDPLSVNPQASMPAFDKLSDSDLQALVTYLLSLK
jgi:mono/diheme cytochrome c family protein